MDLDGIELQWASTTDTLWHICCAIVLTLRHFLSARRAPFGQTPPPKARYKRALQTPNCPSSLSSFQLISKSTYWSFHNHIHNFCFTHYQSSLSLTAIVFIMSSTSDTHGPSSRDTATTARESREPVSLAVLWTCLSIPSSWTSRLILWTLLEAVF